MRKLLFTLAVILLAFEGYSQQSLIDSLSASLTNQKDDTSRIKTLLSLSREYRDMLDHDKAMILAKQGMDLSRKIGFRKGEARALNMKAILLSDKGNKAGSLDLYLQALAINEEIGNLDGVGRCLNNIGSFYLKPGSYRLALPYFLQALAVWDEMEKTTPSADVNNSVVLGNITLSYRSLKMYDSARYFAQKAYQKGKAKQVDDLTASGLAHMGMISSEEGQYGLAVEYFREALPLAKGHTGGELQLMQHMSQIFEKKGEMDSALYYARKTAAIAIPTQLPEIVNESATLMSNLYKKMGSEDSAMFYLEMAVAARDTLEVREQRAEVQNLLFNEKFRQQEKLEFAAQKAAERKRNLEYATVALAAIVLIIAFLVFSHSIIANQRLIKFLGILVLLIVFEFINLFIHPYLDKWTNHSIPLMLVIMVCIAALLIPLHHKLEHWITSRLVEKNNKIRLAAAKKTVSKLESENG